jgi:putative FmdB family regulatory protein
MPIYEYECSSCRYYLEVMQKIADAPLKKCPSCGRNALKKLVSAPAFRLKGSGWYETDFKSDQERKRNLVAAESKAEAPASGDAAAKSEPSAKDKGSESPVPKAAAEASDKGARPAAGRRAGASARSAANTRPPLKKKSAPPRARPTAKSAGRRKRR